MVQEFRTAVLPRNSHGLRSLRGFELGRALAVVAEGSVSMSDGGADSLIHGELDKFESLKSRFARISDILTQKILKSIFLLLREDVKTFIDRINKAEKLEMIDSAEQLKTIRDLRNEIAHEYCIEDISEIFENVLKYGGTLLGMIGSIKKYIDIKQLTTINE